MTTVISEDQDHTVTITKDVERLEVLAHVTIQPSDFGPAILSDHIDSVILNSGTLQSYDGVVLNHGDGDRFVNKSHGVIQAVEDGVLISDAVRVQVTNHGQITGQYGLVVDNVRAGRLNNDGSVSGDSSAVRVSGSGHQTYPADMYVQNDGVLEGRSGFAISMEDASVALYLTNNGTMSGGAGGVYGQMDYANVINNGTINGGLFLGEALRTCNVTNSGLIEGDVHLSQKAENDYDGEYSVDSLVTGVIYGGQADDLLNGGYGVDRFYGGLGADSLAGLPGADLYIYGGARESTAARQDSIYAWDADDKLDLSRVDADKSLAGRQHATFGGEVNPGDPAPAGQVVWYQTGGDTYVVLNHNATGADSSLVVAIMGDVELTADNFVL